MQNNVIDVEIKGMGPQRTYSNVSVEKAVLQICNQNHQTNRQKKKVPTENKWPDSTLWSGDMERLPVRQ